jgi:hypothetical protein
MRLLSKVYIRILPLKEGKRKMRKVSLLLLVIAALFVPFVNAEIFLDSPSNIYNLGDEIVLSATVDSLSDSFFTMELVCGGEKVLITRDILSSTVIRKSFPLTKAFIGKLKGECYVWATYASSTAQSQVFTISDRTDAYLELDKKDWNPSENMIVKIDAVKANGKPINGFANIVFDNAGIAVTVPVINGKVTQNFSLPKNIAAGVYSIKTEVYEKDKQGEVINKVSLENNVVIKQEPRKVEVSIEDQEALPGEEYKFRILVYDQTDKIINTQARYSLYDGDDLIISDALVDSDTDVILQVLRNESPGYRTIVASINGLSSKRFFYIPEVERVSFEMTNTTLKITNTGNVPYRKNVEIGIGENKEVIELELAVDESISYNLQAPAGDYNIEVTDGVESFAASGISLTGNAVRVVDLADDSSLLTRYSLVWLFVLGVLGLFIFGVSKGLGKQKFFSYMPNPLSLLKRRSYGNTDSSVPSVSTIKSSDIKYSRITPREAEHSLVIKGRKEACSLIAIKIKNKQAVEKSDNFKSVISSITSDIIASKGTVYNAGDYLIGILAPSSTRTFKNDSTAVRIAQDSKSALQMNNSRMKSKIDFGIGVNHGDLVVEIDKQTKKLKFTSIGNALSLAKKLADSANGEVLISTPTQRAVSSGAKVKKTTRGDTEAYELNSLVDRDENSKFINDFKSRNEYG